MLRFYLARPTESAPVPEIMGLRVASTLRSARQQNLLDWNLALLLTLNRWLLRTEFKRYAVYREGMWAHHQTVLGKNPRFPFMGVRDVCVSYAYTAGRFRRQGLYTSVLRKILADYADRAIWIFAAEENTPSLRVIENLGFEFVGLGHRTIPFGVRFLGRFEIEEWVCEGCRENLSR